MKKFITIYLFLSLILVNSQLLFSHEKQEISDNKKIHYSNAKVIDWVKTGKALNLTKKTINALNKNEQTFQEEKKKSREKLNFLKSNFIKYQSSPTSNREEAIKLLDKSYKKQYDHQILKINYNYEKKDLLKKEKKFNDYLILLNESKKRKNNKTKKHKNNKNHQH